MTSLTEAAIFADEFVLTHKVVFSPLRSSRRVMERSHNPKTVIVQNDEQGPDSRECFYCREKGHLIAACPVLQRKNQRKAHKSVAFVRTHSSESMLSIDPTFEPFVCDGTVQSPFLNLTPSINMYAFSEIRAQPSLLSWQMYFLFRHSPAVAQMS